MGTRVLLFEGPDGSGKTTLIENFQNHLMKRGRTILLVGRDFNETIDSITKIITNKNIELDSNTEILLRLARENERIKIVAQNIPNYEYLILDRSIISAVSWINFHNQDSNKYRNLVLDLTKKLGKCEVIYCQLPFEESWKRTTNRPEKELSKKEAKGKEFNRKIFEVLRTIFIEFNYENILKYEISAMQSKEDCLSNLLNILEVHNT